MGEAAAEGPARADGIMRNMAHDSRQQAPERTFDHRLVKRGVTDAGTDAQLAVLDGKPPERLDPVDIHEMRGTREPKGHDRDEALSPRQHAAIFRRDLGQRLDRLGNGLRRVVAKRRGFHSSFLD